MPILLYPDIASTGGGAPTEYETYAGLPASGSNGDLAIVTGSGTQDVYEYLATLDGVSVGVWIPSEYSQKISGFVEDASSYKSYIDITGGDSHNDLTSRGWVQSDTGTVEQGVTGGYLYFRQASSASATRLYFSPATMPDNVLIYYELAAISSIATTPNGSALMFVSDTSSRVNITNCLNNNLNRAAFGSSAAGYPQIGAGYVDFNDYDPMFIDVRLSGFKDETSKIMQPDIDEGSAIVEPVAYTTNYIYLMCYNANDDSAEFRIKRLFVFDLT